MASNGTDMAKVWLLKCSLRVTVADAPLWCGWVFLQGYNVASGGAGSSNSGGLHPNVTKISFSDRRFPFVWWLVAFSTGQCCNPKCLPHFDLLAREWEPCFRSSCLFTWLKSNRECLGMNSEIFLRQWQTIRIRKRSSWCNF